MDNRTVELLEQYEDALMAVLMDEYAETNGAKLLEEYEKAERSGAISDVPDKLDKKCRDLIHRSYERQRIRFRFSSIVKVSKRVASLTLVLLGLCSILVFSVDAIRTPVVNYFIQQYEKLTTIDFGNCTGDSIPTTEQTNETHSTDKNASPLVGMIPDTYKLVQYSDKGKRGFTCYYENDCGNVISFMATPAEGLLNIDTENATVADIELLGFNGILIEKDGTTLVWFDASAKICYQLWSTGMPYGELWSLAEEIAKCSSWIDYGSGG